MKSVLQIAERILEYRQNQLLDASFYEDVISVSQAVLDFSKELDKRAEEILELKEALRAAEGYLDEARDILNE